MSNFDFDSVIKRRGTGSYKWDSLADDVSIPMWVADMDFRTAPAVIDALTQRVQHGIFGYTKVPDDYYAALISWLSKRHHLQIERDWVLYTSGVVPAISAILKAVTQPGDKVVVQTPAYNCFFSSIRNMECQLVENPLVCHDQYYQMDYHDLEQKVSDPKVKALLLCNPHNPVGRSWTEDELKQLGDICARYGVIVISDEIHCDLVHPSGKHTPFATLGKDYLENSISCFSPSKAFNLAGLQIANIIAADSLIRERIDKALNIHEVCDVNPFGVDALIAAYTQGEAWLDALRAYLYENYQIVSQFFAENLPDLKVTREEATYLVWVDIRALQLSSEEVAQKLSEEGHLCVNPGTLYGREGEGFIRLNVACPKKLLLSGLNRIQSVFG
ncbi:MalY/PatB family protein [Celerinatantimonas sp. YJH-8]|uniref:MalY/PatB family protein n=1 Tax=Celerinatantimonas sp. YJH-8 TaxID=3228714 RepID=UPI0038C372EC